MGDSEGGREGEGKGGAVAGETEGGLIYLTTGVGKVETSGERRERGCGGKREGDRWQRGRAAME